MSTATFQGVDEALSLKFLLTSRQIYEEARLLPFQANNFVVEFGLGLENFNPPGVDVLEALVGNLAPKQRHAIRHVVLALRDSKRGDEAQMVLTQLASCCESKHVRWSLHDLTPMKNQMPQQDGACWRAGQVFSWFL